MGRILLASNRLPISIVRRGHELRFQSSVGGLATGLGTFSKSHESLWIGWPGITTENLKGKIKQVQRRLTRKNYCPVFLSQRQVEDYYHGFCNKTIWPLFHYFNQYVTYNENMWHCYEEVNREFCSAVVKAARPNDIIWIHDYQLMLLPNLIREKLPNAAIGFFLHIPFPSYEVFRLLPWRRQILDGLLGADLVGFHTYDYVRNFLDSVRRLLGYEHTLGQICVGNHITKADIFPMGIDYEYFSTAVDRPEIQEEARRITRKVGERKIILSIDRLDYTKGILQRLESFDRFLEKNGEYRERVTMILVAVPSRTRVEHYLALKKSVDEFTGRINGKYGTIGWVPIWYLHRLLPHQTLVALYNSAQVALVTPIRDGMNLISKEFIATKKNGKGVLILSEMAGAARDLGEAIIVNPNNQEEVAEAIRAALTMSEEEQIERNRIMQKRLERYNVIRWARDFMDSLLNVKEIQKSLSASRLTREIKNSLVSDYVKSENRLILLDYDGTLTPFVETPEKARPDPELLRQLKAFAQKPQNEVVVASGRDRNYLEKWFGNLSLGLVAEHGAWIKEKGGAWTAVGHLRGEWKEKIRPFLELYADRTPGSFVEEKEFSLVWHYRKADPELASLRTRELKDAILHLTGNLGLEISDGNKIVEIKNAGVDKGQAAAHWLSMRDWDFVLAIGDDLTDENLFAVVPKQAYSIKVGYGPSRAKFSIESYSEVRALLLDLDKL